MGAGVRVGVCTSTNVQCNAMLHGTIWKMYNGFIPALFLIYEVLSRAALPAVSRASIVTRSSRSGGGILDLRLQMEIPTIPHSGWRTSGQQSADLFRTFYPHCDDVP